MIGVIKLKNGPVLISQVQSIQPDTFGGPNVELINPYLLPDKVRWMSEYTDQTTFSINDSNILTIMLPNQELLKDYKELNGIIDETEYIEEEEQEEEHY